MTKNQKGLFLLIIFIFFALSIKLFAQNNENYITNTYIEDGNIILELISKDTSTSGTMAMIIAGFFLHMQMVI
jgi:hypothetical protein